MKKQKQITQTNDLARSFKATSKVAMGLTRERIKIQHDLLKIGDGTPRPILDSPLRQR